MPIMLIVMVSIIVPLSINFYNLYKPKINIKTLYILIVLMILNFLLCVNIDSILLVPVTLIVFLIIGYLQNKKAIIYNLFISTICFLILLINDAISFLILNRILDINYIQTLSGMACYAFLMIILSHIVSFIFSKTINSLLKEKDFLHNKKMMIIVALNILFSFLIICISYYISKVYKLQTVKIFNVLYLLLILGYISSSLGTAYFFNSSYKNKMKRKLEKEELKRIVEYSNIIENMYVDLRKFRHDYVNILSSIGSYIDEKKWSDLELYFKDNILPTKEIVLSNDSVSKLHNIKITYLKSLIYSKVVKSENFGIKTYIDISEPLTDLNIDPVDICRVIGILMDNAIEGSMESKDKFLRFALVYKGNSFVVVVENSCRDDVAPIFKMLEKNFSTKGKNRGLGLYNLKEILSKYDYITYTFNVENNICTSEIWIRM